jgi:hypothetical protein
MPQYKPTASWFASFLCAGCLLVQSGEVFSQEWRVVEKQTDTMVIPSQSVAILGVAVTGAYFLEEYFDEQVRPAFHIGVTTANSEMISNYGEIVALSLPAVFFLSGKMFAWNSKESEKIKKVSTELVQTMAMTISTTYALKFSVSRERPNHEDDYSFPSAHTSEAFAAATTIALNYPWYVGVPSLAAAGVIGMSRFDLEKHYLSDVVVGAGIGAFYSTLFHWINHRMVSRSTTRLSKKQQPAFMPLATNDTFGLTWQMNL